MMLLGKLVLEGQSEASLELWEVACTIGHKGVSEAFKISILVFWFLLTVLKVRKPELESC